MTDTQLRPYDHLLQADPGAAAVHRAGWSRRRVLALVCAGGTLSAAGSIGLLASTGEDDSDVRPISRGRGTWTSFGSVALVSATRVARPEPVVHLHDDPAAPLAQRPRNRTWSTVVRVQVEVHNGSGRPVLMSPGQFRLRVGATGPTVSPYDFGRPAAAVPAARTVRTWISYLAPVEESDLRVEYDDPALSEPLAFSVPLSVPAARTLR